jgi:hypothetical protein
MSMRVGLGSGAGVVEGDDGKGCTEPPTIHGKSLPRVDDGVELVARMSEPVNPADDGGGCTTGPGFPPKPPVPRKGGPLIE